MESSWILEKEGRLLACCFMGYRVHCEDCFVNLLKNETPSQLEHVLMNYAYPSEKKK